MSVRIHGLHFGDHIINCSHICSERQCLVSSFQLCISSFDLIGGCITVGGDLLSFCQSLGKGSPRIRLIPAFIQFLDAVDGRDQVRVVSTLHKAFHGVLQSVSCMVDSHLVCILSGRDALRFGQRSCKRCPAGGRVIVFHQGGSLLDQLIQNGLVHNRLGGLGRSVQFGLVDADAGSPTGGIGTADIQLEDPSGRIAQIIGGNIGRVIGGLGTLCPVRSVCQHSVPFLGLHGQQFVHVDLFFVQHIELVIGSVHAAVAGRRRFRHADVGDDQLPDVAFFANVKGDPQVAAILAPFAGIGVFLVAVKQLFGALGSAQFFAVVANDGRILGHQFQLAHRLGDGHGSAAGNLRILNRGRNNGQLLCGLVLRNGQQAGLVDLSRLRDRAVHAPGHRMVGDILAVDHSCKLLGCALLHRCSSGRYRNRCNDWLNRTALQGNIHIVGLAFGHDQALHNRVVDQVAFRNFFALNGVRPQYNLSRFAGSHSIDLFVVAVVNAISNAGQFLALGIGRHQVQVSGRFRECGDFDSILIRDQLTDAFYLQGEFTARTRDPNATDNYRGFASSHRERGFGVFTRVVLVNVDHIAFTQAIHRKRNIDVATVGRAKRARL